jgi:uncharacterized alkaline shock family protein YloU
MTEVTAGVPAQRAHYDPDQTDVGLARMPAYSSSPGDSLAHVEPAAPSAPVETSMFRDSVDLAGTRVGEFASGAAEKAGEYAHSAAKATGEFATHVADRIRNNAELHAERGSTTIADEVVEKIAGYAARVVEGVYDLGGDVARALASVKERVGLGHKDDMSAQGVTVRLEGNTASVRIVLVIEYGYVVYSVTEKVRSQVIGAVESLLGLEVTAVDINVDDVHIDESKLAATVKASPTT